MKDITPESLQSLSDLKEVPLEQLQWLINNSEERFLEIGDELYKPGSPIEHTQVLLEGRLRVYYIQNNDTHEVTIFEPGTITGYLPFSRAKISSSYMEAIAPVRILSLPIQNPPSEICHQYELTQALVHIMVSRVREFTAQQQQNEKMMALGKLSAGLAHELNNPASAVVRGAASLKNHLQMLTEGYKDFIQVCTEPQGQVKVDEKLAYLLTLQNRPVLGLMERNSLEEQMSDWLEAQGIAHAFEIAENLVEFGFSPADAEELKLVTGRPFLSAAFNWINTMLITERMLADIGESAKRISELVGAVKNFSHMDQAADKQYADIHYGISNTVIMLQHKIRLGGITVNENFDTTLPPVKAMIGELNQVWTNLIDNAIDAMDGVDSAVLEIKTTRDGDEVFVSVIDNGPGIPEEVMSQIFDPFFTTKGIGKGTGLGLDLVSRIVRQHKGSIKVKSVPGRTEFQVCFPIDG